MSNLFETFDKWIRRGDALTEGPVLSSDTSVEGISAVAGGSGVSSASTNNIINDGVDASNILPGEMGALIGHGKKTFSETTAGYLMGLDSDGIYKFIIGDSSNWMDWAVTTAAILTIHGTIYASAGEIGGWTITATTLHSGSNITLDSSNKSIWINDSTFGNSGIQLEYNSGTPRFYVGDGTTYFFKYDGTNISWGASATTLSTAGLLTTTSATIGGWNVVSGYIYNLQSGTPTSSPNDGIVLASGNEAIIIYEDTAKRTELGYLSAGVYGLKVYDGAGTGTLMEISDTQQIISGWTIGATTLANSTNIILDSSNKAISINSATWQAQGIQLEYNAGTPRAYIGDGGVTASDYYIMFDGTNISWNAVATSLSVAGLLTTTSADIGGWNVVAGYIYNLQSGTPTSSPNDGIVLASGNEGIIVYEDTAKRAELGFLSTGVYGLKVYATNGTDVIFEASDTQQKMAGWYFDTTSLADNTTAANAKIYIDSANTLIRAGATTGNYLTFDGANLRIRSSNYVANVSGFTIEPTLIEAENIVARGELRSSVFVKDEIHATGGTMLILGAGTLKDDATTATASSTTVYTQVSQPSGTVLTFAKIYPPDYAVADSFTVSGNYILTSCTWYIGKHGSPTGNVYAKLYASSSNKPTGSALATSNALDISTLTASETETTFTFPTGCLLANGSSYCIVLEYNGGDVNNCLKIWSWWKSGGGYAYSYYNSSTWIAYTDNTDKNLVTGVVASFLSINDLPSGHAQIFTASDILRIKDGSGKDNYLKVISATDNTTYYTYNCSLQSGTAGTFYAGTAVIDYKQSGNGYILLTSDLTNSPYISIATHAGSPWSAVTEKVRLGNLTGITDSVFGALSGYGLWTDNVYLTGAVNASSGRISGAFSILGALSVSTAGSISSGQTAYDTGTGFWMEYNAGTPRLSIGNSAGNKLLWNGTSLAITGSLTAVSGSSSEKVIISSGAVTGYASDGTSEIWRFLQDPSYNNVMTIWKRDFTPSYGNALSIFEYSTDVNHTFDITTNSGVGTGNASKCLMSLFANCESLYNNLQLISTLTDQSSMIYAIKNSGDLTKAMIHLKNDVSDGEGICIDQNGTANPNTALLVNNYGTNYGIYNININTTDETEYAMIKWDVAANTTVGRWALERVDHCTDKFCMIMGGYYFWVDTNGKFRIKSGRPTSDTDGTIVGTQS